MAAWDDTDCVLALGFNAWSKGNGTSDQNTGEFPGYPNGDDDSTLTNMDSSNGYFYNSGNGYCNFDGVNDKIISSCDSHTFTSTSKCTWEIKFRYDHTGNSQSFWSQWDDSDNFVLASIRTDGAIQLIFKVAGTAYNTYSSTVMSDDTDYTLHFVKNGSTTSLYMNGAEVSYSARVGYSGADKAYTQAYRWGILDRGGADIPIVGKVYWLAVYDTNMSTVDISNNAGLSNAMDETFFNVGDDMQLTSPTDPAATPVFSPLGTTGPFTSSIDVSMTDSSTGVTIYYTTDNTAPSTSSTAYTGAITLSNTTVLRAIASGGDFGDSPEATGTYTIEVDDLVASPASTKFTGSTSVALTCATSGVSIYYTTDGSTPDATDTLYSTAISVTSTTTIKAIGIKANTTSSPILSETYTKATATPVISITAPPEVVGKNSFTDTATIGITCATASSTIYYTVDGSTPTSSSTEYTVGFVITESTTIKAIAVSAGIADSNVSTFNARKGSKRIRLFNHFNLIKQRKMLVDWYKKHKQSGACNGIR